MHTIVREQTVTGRQMLRASLGLPNEAPQSTHMDKLASSTATIDLVSESVLSQENSNLRSIFGSPVSVGSTRAQEGNDGKPTHFSRPSQGTMAASQPMMFATMQWKPKEPPCFFGRSTEDVHTWTSLVCHYLTFMRGR